MRVAIVGGGVIGITSAVAVKTAFPDHEVTVFADVFTPGTTGDGSAGLWGPYLLGETPPEKILRWAGGTHRWLEELWRAGLAKDAGICLLPVIRVNSGQNGETAPQEFSWTKAVYGATRLTQKQLDSLNHEQKSKYREGWHFVTYTCEPIRLLPCLMKRFVALGGKLIEKKVQDLSKLPEAGYDLVINCTGLGARELVKDKLVTPIRGQIAKVKASWAMHCYLVDDDDCNYIIPNMEHVVLGGTHQEGDYDRSVSKEDTKFIYDGCHRMIPALQVADTIAEWVGLRPGRPSIRLEVERCRAQNGLEYTVIHNYGHGGAGVTLSWGCALDVVELVRSIRIDRHSKL